MDKFIKDISGNDYIDSVIFQKFSEIIKRARSKKVENWIRLLYTLNKSLNKQYKPESVETLLTKYRKLISDKFGPDSPITIYAKKNTGLTPEENKARIEERQEELNNKISNRGDQVEIKISIIKKMYDDFINTDDPLKVSIGLMIASGARFNELFTAEFKRFNNNQVEISNMSKGGKSTVRKLNWIDSNKFLTLINFIREQLDGSGSKSEITNRYNAGVNRRIKQYINLTGHKMRYISAFLAFQSQTGRNKRPEDIFYQEYLNHNSGEVSKAYRTLNIINDINDISKVEPENKIPILTKNDFKGEDRKNELLRAVQYLKDNNIKPSFKKLKELGFGSKLITKMKVLNH